MDIDEEQYQRLIDGLRAGDPRIEREFWELYGSNLGKLAERRLSPKLQARVGPEDIAQSVCRTFMRRARAGEFQLPDSAALWRLLCVITLTKAREHARFHSRSKRSIDREQPLAPPGQDSEAKGLDPAGGEDPAEAIAIADEMEHLLTSLDQQDRQIVELKLQDMTNDEVARQLNLSERTVRRTLKRLESRLSGSTSEEES